MSVTASPLGAANSMMTIAQKETGVAMFVLPPAMWINFQFKLAKGNPANLDKAGQAWRDVAQQLQQVGTDLRQAIAKVPPDDWTADDRTAYEQKVKEFCSQLEIMSTFCLAVGIALTVFAYALFTYAVFAVGMGTFIGALSGIAAAAMVSVVGAELYADCLAMAATCLEVTTAATAILAGAGAGVGAVFQGGAVLSAVAETFKGNQAALGDLKQAEVTGLASAGANLLQNAANAGLNYVNRADDLGASPEGTPKGIPLKAVDLDADRDKDHTWSLGGTATGNIGGNSVTGGGHVKVGDQGLQGAEVEGKVTHDQVTAGGKVGWDRDAQGHDTVHGSESVGYENKGTGAGAREDAEGKVNIDQGATHPRWDSGKISLTEGYKGGDLAKEEAT